MSSYLKKLEAMVCTKHNSISSACKYHHGLSNLCTFFRNKITGGNKRSTADNKDYKRE